MQIKIEIDVRPDELRRFLGLPDVAGLQEDLIAFVRDKVSQASDSFDAGAFVKSNLDLLNRNPTLRRFLNVGWRDSADANSPPEAPTSSTPNFSGRSGTASAHAEAVKARKTAGATPPPATPARGSARSSKTADAPAAANPAKATVTAPRTSARNSKNKVSAKSSADSATPVAPPPQQSTLTSTAEMAEAAAGALMQSLHLPIHTLPSGELTAAVTRAEDAIKRSGSRLKAAALKGIPKNIPKSLPMSLPTGGLKLPSMVSPVKLLTGELRDGESLHEDESASESKLSGSTGDPTPTAKSKAEGKSRAGEAEPARADQTSSAKSANTKPTNTKPTST